MDSHVDPQDFGELIGTVKALSAAVSSLQEKVEDLNMTMAHAKGSWAGVAGVAAVVGALIEGAHYVVSMVKGH